MQLPFNFEFSQSSLQDYTDCRKRFFLRYIQQVAWPAVQTEPVLENERHIRRGERFHRMVQQYLLGVPIQRLDEIASADPDEHLPHWWQSFLTSLASTLDGARSVELTLTAPLAGYRLTARYDLILSQADGHLVIYDWKTSLNRPKHVWLAARLQTRIYLYLLVRAGKDLMQGNAILNPEQVSMIYWFTEFPTHPERFNYSNARFIEDGRILENLVTEILSLPETGFELTPHKEHCAFCVYRSLCDRGIWAGSISNIEDEPEPTPPDLALDLEQTAEISF